MTEQRILNPKNDLVFKRIFGTEANKACLLSLLNATLSNQTEGPIEDVTFLPKSQDPNVAYLKQSIVDVLCKDEAGNKYVIEMQVAHSIDFSKRAVYYASKVYTSQMHKGMKYADLKAVIFLAFCDFNIFPDSKHHKTEHALLEKESYIEHLEGFSFTFLNLPKFDKSIKKNERPYSDMTLEEKWCYFLRRGYDASFLGALGTKAEDKEILQAYSELDAANWTEAQLNTYEDYLKTKMDNESALDYREAIGIEKGRKVGLSEGLEKGKLETALKIIASGQNIKFASQVTGLSEAFIAREHD